MVEKFGVSRGASLTLGDIRYLATCSADTTVKIWSIGRHWEFKLEKVLQGHQRWVWDCAFSADSAYLVTGTSYGFGKKNMLIAVLASSDHTARLWEMASGETVRQYNGHHKGVLSFSSLRTVLKHTLSCCLLRFARWSWLTRLVDYNRKCFFENLL